MTTIEEYEIYRKIKRELLIEDIKSKAIEMGYDVDSFTDEDWNNFADHAESAIDRNDNMWECYWMSIDYALEHI